MGIELVGTTAAETKDPEKSLPRAINSIPVPSCARPNSIRLVENTPLLAEEAAEVSTTKLMILAAAGRPTSTKSSTNGLLFGTTELVLS